MIDEFFRQPLVFISIHLNNLGTFKQVLSLSDLSSLPPSRVCLLQPIIDRSLSSILSVPATVSFFEE